MSDDSMDSKRTGTARGAARATGILVGIEAVGLAALAAWQVVALAAHDTESVVSAAALLGLTIIGTLAVAAFAVGVMRGQSWARSGAIVTQLLILAVALGAATGQYAHPLVGVALAAPAVVILVLLILASRRAGGRSDAQGDGRG